MKPRNYLLIVLLALLSSCAGDASRSFRLEGLYEFSQGYGGQKPPLNCFLNIEKNGKYTLFIPDYFDYGHWEREAADSNRIVFYSSRPQPYYGASFSLQISAYEEGQLRAVYSLAKQIESTYGNGDLAFDQVKTGVTPEVTLIRDPVQYPDSLDPYSLPLNRWRLRSAEPESCKEISYRTINYLKHMYVLFNGQYQQQAERYGYAYSPSPLLYGQNGIATIKFDDIPNYWIGTFYNEEQARQGAEMISMLFDEPLKMPKDYKRYDELWSKILKQMLGFALKKDFCAALNAADTTQAP